MICRIWRGIAPAEKADECDRALQAVAKERCLALPGIDGAIALKRIDRGMCEILFISLWNSMKSLNCSTESTSRGVAPGVDGPPALVKTNRSVDLYEVILNSFGDQPRPQGFFNEISPMGVIW
jgi:hypothetical protein